MKTFRTLLSLMVVIALMSAFPPIRTHAAEELGYHLIEVESTAEKQNADMQDYIMQENSRSISGKITGVDGMISVIDNLKQDYLMGNKDVNPHQSDVTWTKLPELLTPGETLELTAELYTNSEWSGSEATFSSAYSNNQDDSYTDSYYKNITGSATREFLEIPVPRADTYFTFTVYGGSLSYKCTITYLYKLVRGAPVDSGARFSSISGQVEYLEPGSDEWEFAKNETVLVYGAKIKTAMESSCVISLEDFGVLELKQESQIEITPPEPGITTSMSEIIIRKIKIMAGLAVLNVKNMFKDGKLIIETPEVVAEIEGTIFSIEKTADKTILEVFEGAVQFTCLASGEKVLVESGQTAYGDTKLSPVTEFDKNADKEQWDRLIGTAGTAGTSSTTDAAETESDGSTSYLWLILAGAGLAVILVILILILVMKKKKSRKLNPPQPQNFVTLQPPAAVSNPPSFCEKCGAKVDAGISFCANCGNRVN